jgi:nucleoside transporter
MMFLEFFIWGSWYVTTGPYMAENGMSDLIKHAYSVGPIAAIISPFFLGLVADRFFATERVLGCMHILGGVAMLIAPQTSGYAFIGILLFHMLCFMPTLGLTNTLAFHNITDQEKQFPVIRVFGTIGWIAAGWVISWVLNADTSSQQYYLAGGASIALGLYSFTLMHTPPPAKEKEVHLGEILGLDALTLLRQPPFLVFIVASLLICIPLAAYYAFAGQYVNASGAFAAEDGVTDVGFYMSFGQMSEVFFMFIMPLCFAALGVKWMLLVGMLAWVVRYGLFSAAASAAPDPAMWMILGGILLHGICYDFFFVTGQIYTDQKSGKEIRGQAQGFLVLVTQGIGMLIGAQVSGALFAEYVPADGAPQWNTFWLIPSLSAGVIMVAFFLLFWDRTDRQAAPSEVENQPEASKFA